MAEAIDIRSRLPSVRDQGVRPTCLSFAMSDAHMFATRCPGLLSPEYLHFHATRRAGVGLNAGVDLSNVREALEFDGQPLEAECPYADPRPDAWVPPPGFTKIWTRASRLCIGTASDVLTNALLGMQAHVLVFRISRSFYIPDSESHIVVEDGSKDNRLHAVVIVGMANVAGGMAFLARNSWGGEWGQEGHAWLPLAYIDARAVDIIEMEADKS